MLHIASGKSWEFRALEHQHLSSCMHDAYICTCRTHTLQHVQANAKNLKPSRDRIHEFQLNQLINNRKTGKTGNTEKKVKKSCYREVVKWWKILVSVMQRKTSQKIHCAADMGMGFTTYSGSWNGKWKCNYVQLHWWMLIYWCLMNQLVT